MRPRCARPGMRLRRAALLAAFAVAACSESGAPDFPGAGRVLTLELTTRLDDGREVDTTRGQEPLVVTLGDGKLLPALEQQLGELGAGDEREIVLEPADAYGERVPELLQPVPLERIPEDHREIGKVVIGEAPDGSQRSLRIHEIREAEAILDLNFDKNHPLAGERVHFLVKVLKAD